MKNAFFIFCAGMLICFSASAQKKKAVKAEPPVQVPENVNSTFKNMFAVAENGQWKKTYKGNYVALFTNAEKQSQSVEYDATGNVVKNKISYSTEALPQQVNNVVAQKYPDMKIIECMRVELPGIKPYYKVRVADTSNSQKELLISEEGTVSE